ncbi:MAG: T9SS type A sorting domain-containing protein [Candidatus Cloacimonetes bacterium]|jgi:ligand-binding sensor domain-containing protein|nr:T9SS type A sorting domain-containing protein [Candidatus Cloacimonadota bacterium]MDY0366744.1 T9SS type A sorting domain-containing protein [Candidatus Syntrophosphaera sp.]HOY85072.1 T9SS type A sorting domain-containing protein [Candidatus Syntrophosphaera sp.]HPH60517.1 T9SS type A sorting domain-containing protein [Candidatus Syntrophosphaera sp.]
MKTAVMALLFLFAVAAIPAAQWELHSFPTVKGNMIATPNHIYYINYPGLGRIDRLTQEIEIFYTFNSGLQEATLLSLYYDNDGLLWIGGLHSLTTFDGDSTWQSFDLSTAPVDPGWISAIHKDSAGNLWLGCTHGLFKYDFSTWTHFNTFNTPLDDMEIQVIEIDHLDRVWIGTLELNSSLACYDGVNWTQTDYHVTGQIKFILEDRQNNIWVGASNLSKYDGSRWAAILDPGIGDNWLYFYTADVDSQNNLYVICYGDLYRLDSQGWSMYEESGSLREVAVDSGGAVYYSSDRLFRLHTELAGSYQVGNVYPASSSLRDSQNKLWIGQINGGISIFDGTQWQFLDETTDPQLQYGVMDLEIDADGFLWALTRSHVVLFLDGYCWSTFELPDLEDYYHYTCLEFDGQGNPWIGSNGNGLYIRQNDVWQHYSSQNSGLPGDLIDDITKDQQGRMWMLTNDGIAVNDNGNWQVYNHLNAPFEPQGFSALACDAQNRIWVRNGPQLCRCENGTWSAWAVPSTGSGTYGDCELGFDALGRVWVGLGIHGVGIFDGTDWQVWNQSNSQLQDSWVWSVFSDTDGGVWICLTAGFQVYRYDGVASSDPHLVPAVSLDLRCYPNPASKEVQISFCAKDRDRYRVQVFNVRGQLVRDLSDTILEAGRVENLAWDGQDGQGKPAPNGLYLLRVNNGTEAQTRRVILLR